MRRKNRKLRPVPNNRLISHLVMLGLLLIGLLIMCYPFYVDAINGYMDNYQIKKFGQEMAQKNAETIALQEKTLNEKNQKKNKNNVVVNLDPFLDVNEDEIISDGTRKEHLIGSVSIPKINITVPMFDTTTDFLLQNGVTVLDNHSMPIGGASTHAIISGRRGLASRKLFTDLDQVEVGDVFVVNILTDNLAYKVEKIQVVKPKDLAKIAIQPSRDLVTLLTSTPYMVNSHRLLVTGHRVSYTDSVAKKVAMSDQGMTVKQLFIIGSLIVGVLMILMVMLHLIRQSKRNQTSRIKRTKNRKD